MSGARAPARDSRAAAAIKPVARVDGGVSREFGARGVEKRRRTERKCRDTRAPVRAFERKNGEMQLKVAAAAAVAPNPNL